MELWGKAQLALFMQLLKPELGIDGVSCFLLFKTSDRYDRMRRRRAKTYNIVEPNDFEWMSVLGKGGFGRVIRGRKKSSGKQFAIKVLAKAAILGATKREAVECRIEREVLAKCESPFIIPLHYAFQTSKAAFLVLDVAHGGDLKNFLGSFEGDKLKEDDARFYVAEIYLALHHLHSHKVIYRDLKPENILMDKDGHCMITDMGLCAEFEGSSLISGDITDDLVDNPEPEPVEATGEEGVNEKLGAVGTVGYRAPELLNSTKNAKGGKGGYGISVDFWALGVTVYRMVVGDKPFTLAKTIRKSMEQLELESQDVEVPYPEVLSEDCISFIKGLLEKDPVNRLGSPSHVVPTHPWLKDLQWGRMSNREVVPPCKPKLYVDPNDETIEFGDFQSAMEKFDQTDVSVMLGGENEFSERVQTKDQKLFLDWEFVSREALKDEVAAQTENGEIVPKTGEEDGAAYQAIHEGEKLVGEAEASMRILGEQADTMSAKEMIPILENLRRARAKAEEARLQAKALGMGVKELEKLGIPATRAPALPKAISDKVEAYFKDYCALRLIKMDADEWDDEDDERWEITTRY